MKENTFCHKKERMRERNMMNKEMDSAYKIILFKKKKERMMKKNIMHKNNFSKKLKRKIKTDRQKEMIKER